MKDLFGNKKPVQIGIDEWWFNGCIIQKQIHPLLEKYCSFKDSDNELPYTKTFTTFKDAVKEALKNGCESPSRTPKDYL